ncbi:MAG: hypothetical protein AB7I27_09300 [Bacteriovoracaceae bacterium]
MKNLIFLLSILGSALSFAGTESGGGGGVVATSNRPVLIDFYQLANPSVMVSEISETDDAFKQAVDILDTWQRLPLDNISYLVGFSFSGPVEWIFTHNKLKEFDHHRPMNISEHERIETVAYYSIKNSIYQINLFRPIWEQMDITNQTALLIHESLRHVQLGLKSYFNEEALQQATVIYMLCRPTVRLSSYLNNLLHNNTELNQKVYGSFNDILSKSCMRK